MIYEVLDEKVGYAKESGECVFIEKGGKVPLDSIDKGFFTQEGLDYLVKKGRLKQVGHEESNSKKVGKGVDLKKLPKDDLISKAVECGFGDNRDLVKLNKNQLIDLLQGTPSRMNKMEKSTKIK
tara:strand:+ start:412 stop:783 length:372 start_codon:yes stop_codon:yes gene_type:complete